MFLRQSTPPFAWKSYIHPSELNRRGIESQFDVVFTYSSVEHSGLGRYGDPLNPAGDLMAAASNQLHAETWRSDVPRTPRGPRCHVLQWRSNLWTASTAAHSGTIQADRWRTTAGHQKSGVCSAAQVCSKNTEEAAFGDS